MSTGFASGDRDAPSDRYLPKKPRTGRPSKVGGGVKKK